MEKIFHRLIQKMQLKKVNEISIEFVASAIMVLSPTKFCAFVGVVTNKFITLHFSAFLFFDNK